MDRDWDRSMRHVINEMLDNSQVAVTYTKKTEIKTKAAVLEAAKRISYSRKVVVVTANRDIQRTVKCLSQAAQEEHGLDSDWFRSVLPGESVSGADCDCVVAVDVEDVTQLQSRSLKMVVSRWFTNPERKEQVVKSSKANTLLGKEMGERSVSSSQVAWTKTKKDTSMSPSQKSPKYMFVDSSGILDINKEGGVHGAFTSRSDLATSFTFVCCAIAIGLIIHLLGTTWNNSSKYD